jgi:hypothetical protein
VAQLFSLGHERFWILLCWFGWRRFGQFDLDEQDFGSSFEFSSRRFERRASAAACRLTSVGICLILL